MLVTYKKALPIVCLLGAFLTGCAAPKIQDEAHLKRFEAKAGEAVKQFSKEYPEIAGQFDSAAGYAIFPTIGQGASGIGLAFGEGLVYSGGDVVGTAGNSVATIGFQFGGQAMRKVVFFNDQRSLDSFRNNGGNLDLAAQINAVFGPWGVGADGSPRTGVDIYTVQRGGLMYEASIGGQYFDYRALDDSAK